MEQPAQRYFCNKCGYVGNVDLHSGCGYLAYHLALFEQNYIDQLERELALLKASPARASQSNISRFLGNERGDKICHEDDGCPTELAVLKRFWREQHRPASAPEGWKIVPVEPTGEMVDAGIRSWGTTDKFRAMLAAAPTPPPMAVEDRKDAESAYQMAIPG